MFFFSFNFVGLVVVKCSGYFVMIYIYVKMGDIFNIEIDND